MFRSMSKKVWQRQRAREPKRDRERERERERERKKERDRQSKGAVPGQVEVTDESGIAADSPANTCRASDLKLQGRQERFVGCVSVTFVTGMLWRRYVACGCGMFMFGQHRGHNRAIIWEACGCWPRAGAGGGEGDREKERDALQPSVTCCMLGAGQRLRRQKPI